VIDLTGRKRSGEKMGGSLFRKHLKKNQSDTFSKSKEKNLVIFLFLSLPLSAGPPSFPGRSTVKANVVYLDWFEVE
jgi:hypothetical protein